MNVLYLTNLPAPYRVDFFNELGKHCNLTVLYQRKNATDRVPCWMDRRAKNFREIYLNGIPLGSASALSFGMRQFLHDPSYDVRIIGGYSTPSEMMAISYLKRRNIPYILSVDGGFYNRNEPSILKTLKTRLVSGATLYLSTGTNADDYLVYYGANPDRIARYHFSSLYARDILTSPPSARDKKNLKQQLGINHDTMVLSVGRMMPSKRYDLVFEAAKIFPETAFYIVGGKDDAYYSDLLLKSGAKNVFFIDFLSYPELARYYQAADVFLMPSDSDVWGMVLIEAAANGLPLIATNCCGAAPNLISEGVNGYIVPKGDIIKICDGLSSLLSSEEKREVFAKNSLSMIKEYHIENETLDHLCAFARCTNR